jgi:hypothetical protein
MQRTTFLFLILISPPLLWAQSPPHSKDLQRLSQSNSRLAEVTQLNPGFVKFEIPGEVPVQFIKYIPQILVKNSNGLFLMPDGTGRVYKILQKDGRTELVRQDSTNFYGYNFGFYAFSYQDTIYSFGGYGYWRYNGHLRVYLSKKGEWEIENLNREIPFSRAGYVAPPIWFNQAKGELWIGYSIDSKEGIIRSDNYPDGVTDSVFVLSLRNKQWKNIGLVNDKVRKLASSIATRNLGPSPWGQIVHDPQKATIYLLDFERNQILTLDEKVTRSITHLLKPESVMYFKDSTYFIQSMKSWVLGQESALDSIQLERVNFSPIGTTVYNPITGLSVTRNKLDKKFFGILTIGFLLGVLLAGLIFYIILKKQKSLFQGKELEIIHLILSKSEKGHSVDIDLINKIIGVTSKNGEVQKKQRSEILISINRKWRYANSTNDLLIKKRRVEQDKRSFEYYVDFENLDRVKEFIG